jgi:hypothetical protein
MSLRAPGAPNLQYQILKKSSQTTSEHNAADAMTKIAQNAAWQEILHTHRVSHPLEQYVIDTRLYSDNCTGN